MPEAPVTEKRLATLMHVISIFAPLWFPFLVWIVVGRSMAFLGAHSRAAAFEGILWKALLLIFGLISIIWTATRLVYHIDTGFAHFEWTEAAIKLAITLLVAGILAIANFITSIFQARSAWKGIWPRREIRLAAKSLSE